MKKPWRDSDTVPAIEALETFLKSESGQLLLKRLQESKHRILLFHGASGGEYRPEFYLDGYGIVREFRKIMLLPSWISTRAMLIPERISIKEMFGSIPADQFLLEEAFPTEHLLPDRIESWLKEQAEKAAA